MAVTRADKEQELQELTAAFTASDTAILVDYKGLDVPAVTELRRQIRGAKAQYKVVKNTLARRASKGTKLASLEASFEGTTAIARTPHRSARRHATGEARSSRATDRACSTGCAACRAACRCRAQGPDRRWP